MQEDKDKGFENIYKNIINYLRGRETMDEKIKVLLVGIGGYGNLYINGMLDKGQDHNAVIAGVVDPYPEGSNRYNDIIQAGIPVYASMEEFYQSNKSDLAVISSPIHFHCTQVCTALSNGSHVLCEKPISATPEEAYKMIEMQKSTGLLAGVGYQWSFSKAIRELKKDIQSGDFGKPVQLKALVLWPRDKKYFARGWAGKLTDGKGNIIRDSVANNATAHYLFNMFYVLGETEETSAVPESVETELYRANDIENFDTAAIRVNTKCGTEILYFCTHAVNQARGPVFEYKFEIATVYYGVQDDKKDIYVQFNDGRVKEYGDPYEDSINKLWIMMEAIRGNSNIPCTLETATAHTLCIDAMQNAVPEIPDFPDNLRRYDEEKEVVWIEGLFELMSNCYEEGILPSDTDTEWASKGEQITL